MKAIRVSSCCFLVSILFALIGLFPAQTEAKEWKPMQKEPSPYFFVDKENNGWLIIQGIRSEDGSFQEGMLVYRSTDGINFFPLIIQGLRTEEISFDGNPVKREWVVLKDPQDNTEYEFSQSRMPWEKESQRDYEVLLLMRSTLGNYNQSPRKYVRTSLSCKEIKSLIIHNDK